MIYRFSDCELDTAAGELRRGGRPVALQPKPFALLQLLLEERHRIVPTEELMDRLWPEETVTGSSLARAVSVTRSAIGDSGRAGCIRSYVRRGYRFHGDVLELGEPADPGAPPLPRSTRDGMPFVGREAALARLRAAWERTARGLDGVVLISGPAGIGKTRLGETLEEEVVRRGGLALRGRALEEEGEPAFWVWAQVLRALRAVDPDSLAVPGLSESAEITALMPELAAQPGAASVLPAGQRRFVFFDAVANALRRAARRRPLLVVFEDLHWADPASLRLLEHLVFELSGAAVLLLATVRDAPPLPNDPSVRTQGLLRRHERCESVALAPLDAQDVGRVVEHWLGRREPELARRLHERTDGVPLFLREAGRRLAEARTAPDATALDELPLARVDWVRDALAGVSPRCSELLQAAAVVGREFALPLVVAVTSFEREELLDLLDEAAGAGLVCADPDDPVRYRFVHDLFRESAYASLAPGARIRLHQRIASHLERLHPDLPDRVLVELAHHHHRALAVGDPARVYAVATRAARRAFTLCAYEQALAHGGQALAALDHWAEGGPGERLATLLELGEAARLAGEVEQRRHWFGEAAALARELGRPDAFAAAALGLCDLGEWGVRDEHARRMLEEATRRLDQPGAELEGRLLTRLGYLDTMFEPRAAEEKLRRAVRVLREVGAADALEEALYALHLVLGGPDGRAERGQILEELRGAASAARDPVASVIAVLDVACDRLEEGRRDVADALRHEADRIAGTPPHPSTLWHRRIYDTGLALLEGRHEEVEGRSDEALALGRRIQHPYARGCFAAQRASLHALRDEPEAVLVQLEPALRAQQGPVDWVKLVIARALATLSQRERATSLYLEVMAPGPQAIPRNLRWMATLVELAHAAADLGDADRAGVLLDMLRPYAHHHGVMPMVVCYGGPASFALARLYELLGRADEADELYGEAFESAHALGARPSEARIALTRGRRLKRRGQRKRAREQLALAAALAADLGLPALERAANAALAD